MKNVDVIVPVYRGVDETRECIVSAHQSLPDWGNLIVINDCSPEEELTQWLREHRERYNYSLYENEHNLGFVETVNFGMKLNPDNDVLLLNSDVEVAQSNWLERIRVAAYSKENVASITPFSNNATICSFPNFCEDNDLFNRSDVDELDHVFSRLELEDNLVEVPTGVGFCMYIRRDCLNEVGYFDAETFGKGYGEENDWCQRAVKSGWKNYHQLNVFAYHKGGVSFAEEGDPRKERALELLTQIHPQYTQDVQRFIQFDPAKRARAKAMLLFLSASEKTKVLTVTHRLGGGVTQHLAELETLLGGEVDFVTLKPADQIGQVSLSLSSACSTNIEFTLPDDYAILVELLKYLGINQVHFHHLMGVPESIWSLPTDLEVNYDITVHDFYLINGNPTQTGISGTIIDHLDVEQYDIQSNQVYPTGMSSAEWQQKHCDLLNGAHRVITPSIDTANRILECYPSLANKIKTVYHPDHLDCIGIGASAENLHGNLKKVLILGALSQEKGADLLEEIARRHPEIEFHLVGYGYRPLQGVITYGPYNEESLAGLISKVEPDAIWFTAMWPETYSYTLSIALRYPYPIFAPDIGAFSERVCTRQDSFLVPITHNFNENVKRWDEFFDKAREGLGNLVSYKPSQTHNIGQPNCGQFYLQGYVSNPARQEKRFSLPSENLIDFVVFNESKVALSRRDKVVGALWKIRQIPFISKLVQFIPIAWQKRVKRTLSSKSVHDIVNKS